MSISVAEVMIGSLHDSANVEWVAKNGAPDLTSAELAPISASAGLMQNQSAF